MITAMNRQDNVTSLFFRQDVKMNVVTVDVKMKAMTVEKNLCEEEKLTAAAMVSV